MGDSKTPIWKISSRQRANARALRKNSTDAERAIWSALRGHRLNGTGFKRQVPIGPFIVDFVCHAAHLIIELDGGQHFAADQESADASRSAFLADQGFRVLRFNNSDVMTNRSGVLETIAIALHASAPSLPSPASGGGGEIGGGETI